MKTILITGATSGIGEACARHCLAQGDRVVAICRNLDKARDSIRLVTSLVLRLRLGVLCLCTMISHATISSTSFAWLSSIRT